MFLSDNSSPLRGHVPEQAATWPGQPVPGTAAAASRLGVGAVPFLGSPTLAEKCFINNRLLREGNKGRPALHSQESCGVPCRPWALVPSQAKSTQPSVVQFTPKTAHPSQRRWAPGGIGPPQVTFGLELRIDFTNGYINTYTIFSILPLSPQCLKYPILGPSRRSFLTPRTDDVKPKLRRRVLKGAWAP